MPFHLQRIGQHRHCLRGIVHHQHDGAFASLLNPSMWRALSSRATIASKFMSSPDPINLIELIARSGVAPPPESTSARCENAFA